MWKYNMWMWNMDMWKYVDLKKSPSPLQRAVPSLSHFLQHRRSDLDTAAIYSFLSPIEEISCSHPIIQI